jgi:TIR domain-containing protein/pentapeptide repeat protein
MRKCNNTYPPREQVWFINTTLHKVDFSEAILKKSDLTKVIHKKTKLNGADMSGAKVTDVKFVGTELERTIFDKTTFNRADFHHSIVKGTRFIHVDLRGVSGLETVIHHGHSIIDIDTLILSEGNIPKSFLVQAGVPEKIIEALSLRAEQNNAYKTCFISYSSKDALFVRSLRDHLNFFDVDIWRDQESLKNGHYFSNEITKAIHSSEKFLPVLSKHSAHSPWVKKEVEIAARKGPDVFSPIRLDAFTEMSQNAWVKDLHSRVHIGNFTQYRRPDAYLEALGHLLWSLKRF